MDSLEKFRLDFLLQSDLLTMITIPSSKSTETTINIQASDEWVITGTYRYNQLRGFSLKKINSNNNEVTSNVRN